MGFEPQEWDGAWSRWVVTSSIPVAAWSSAVCPSVLPSSLLPSIPPFFPPCRISAVPCRMGAVLCHPQNHPCAPACTPWPCPGRAARQVPPPPPPNSGRWRQALCQIFLPFRPLTQTGFELDVLEEELSSPKALPAIPACPQTCWQYECNPSLHAHIFLMHPLRVGIHPLHA